MFVYFVTVCSHSADVVDCGLLWLWHAEFANEIVNRICACCCNENAKVENNFYFINDQVHARSATEKSRRKTLSHMHMMARHNQMTMWHAPRHITSQALWLGAKQQCLVSRLKKPTTQRMWCALNCNSGPSCTKGDQKQDDIDESKRQRSLDDVVQRAGHENSAMIMAMW